MAAAMLMVAVMGLALALLLYAALHDLAARTIPNWLPLALVGLGLAALVLRQALLGGLIAATATFFLLFAMWMLRFMGGGDVKLWASTVLLIPPVWQMQLLFTARVLLLGGGLAVLYLCLGRLVAVPRTAAGGTLIRRILRAESWRIARRAPLPYAFAISGAALLTLPNLMRAGWP